MTQKQGNIPKALVSKPLLILGAFSLSSCTGVPAPVPSEQDPTGTTSSLLRDGSEFEEGTTFGGHYFDIILDELPLPGDERGHGGALVSSAEGTVVAFADGSFCLLEVQSKKCEQGILPTIELGSEQITRSESISLLETLPRVHDVVFHEGFYYVSFDRYQSDIDAVSFVIARIRRGEASWSDVYVSTPLESPMFTLGSGGVLAIRPDSNWLYFSIGDFSLDRVQGLPTDFAPQSDDLPWGHILRTNLETFETETVAKGVRNPLGLIFINGDLYSSEMGPRGGDELNLITKGSNYGWPFESLGTYYGSFNRYSIPSSIPSPIDLDESFQQPIYSWLSGVAPSQMIQVVDFHQSWDGNVLMGSLKAESIFHFKITEGRVLFMEQIPIGFRIRDLVEVERQVVILTDTPSILIIQPSIGS